VERAAPTKTIKKAFQPLDRAAFVTMLVLLGLIGLLLLNGDHTSPRVKDFSWQGADVGAADTAFMLTFSRPMNLQSVEENLRIVPPLSGQVSWAGRRMAYTLENPAPYGTAYSIELRDAYDYFSQPEDNRPIQPFVSQFRTHDRAFAYIGIKGEEEGRLVLENLTRQEHKILTPADLVVMDFEPYPNGDRILFSASSRAAQAQSLLDQQLYTVTTGINPQPPASILARGDRSASTSTPQPAGIVALILDDKTYQNLKFDLAPDGNKIVVARVNRQNPDTDYGLWLIQPDAPPQSLSFEAGGDFLIAPDSNSIALSQGQGLSILPLESQAEPLDFLAKFGVILSFSNDGAAAATVQFAAEPNNPQRVLYLVTNQGTEKKLLTTDGSILMAQFDPMRRTLYCLMTQRLPGDLFVEQPYLVAIDLRTGQPTELLKLPVQREIQMSLSPDGLGLLFDQTIAAAPDQSVNGIVRSSSGTPVVDSQLWLLPLPQDELGQPLPTQPQPLLLSGLRPRWLP
jgi:hypothetical protein